MSEEEKFKSIVQEIQDIYMYLTQGEPTPDDEITARERLIDKVQTLKTISSFLAESNMALLEDCLNELDKWDTLELWFVESNLPEFIKKIINITGEAPEFQPEQEIKESPTTRLVEDLETASFDIDQIVDKVSKQFKGEIDGLKHEIDGLKLELEKKDETLKQVSQMKVIKKITPKKDVKLPPPKIKIPVIKKPEKIPQIKAPIKTETKKPIEKIGVTSMKQVKMKIEEELEKLQASSIFEKKIDIEKTGTPKSKELEVFPELPEPEIISEPYKESDREPESILDILEESNKSEDKPVLKMISELPEKPKSIVKNLRELDKSKDLSETPAFTAMPEKPKKSTLISEIIEIEASKEEKEIPFAIKEMKVAEKPDIYITPKIKSVSIEEVETEEIRSTGTDLFNVFSSVGEKPPAKLTKLDDNSDILTAQEKKKKDEKKKKKQEKEISKNSEAIPFIDFGGSKPESPTYDNSDVTNVEELPKDKDSLYQELIALEGKRYSLEKNFNEMEKNYNAGAIEDFEYQNESEELRGKLNTITSRINRIRRVISSL